ncbi:MAG: polysaccharide biosynthesis tyrosine autokinase [Burkholderiales bacterium]|nr:polysaccharide biosynthesis tyrosine autokinase [Anaerolineae bacterium]
MELAQYFRIFRKWLWLILVAAFIGGGVSYVSTSGQPLIYRAQAIMAIGTFMDAPNPNASEIRAGIELTTTYAELVKMHDLLQAVVDRMDMPISADALANMIDVDTVLGTSLFILNVDSTDPVLAADVANGVAEELVRNSPSNLTPDQESQIELAQLQIDALNEQLQQSRVELSAIEGQLAVADDADELALLRDQRSDLINQVNAASGTIASFTETIANLQRRTNSLDIVEHARIPTGATGSSPITTALVGAATGAVLALAVVVFLEYLDDTIKTSLEATEMLALPVLGVIMKFGKPKDKYADRLIASQNSQSPIAEGYRKLRTNLLFSKDEKRKSIYLVTSPGASEGKSVTTANLAVTMASAGLRVLLVDADLRKPRVHEIFGLDNGIGLTSLLLASPPKNGAAPQANTDKTETEISTQLTQVLQSTHVPRLRVITSGFIPDNPTEILGSALMQRWMTEILSSSNVDVVLIDSPPCLAVADSSVLAATTNAEVILVLGAGKTRRMAAIKAKQEIENVGGALKGVVLNNVNARDEYYAYGYSYGYYADTKKDKDKGGDNKNGGNGAN